MMMFIEDYNCANDAALYNVAAHKRRHAWMDEGTSNFNESQARAEFFPGGDHGSADWSQYVRVTQLGIEGELMRRTDYHYDDFARGVAAYSKPATVLMALRALLGEDGSGAPGPREAASIELLMITAASATAGPVLIPVPPCPSSNIVSGPKSTAIQP